MAGIEEVLKLAREVRARAHAPYSGYRVGAVLESTDGTLFLGCNVESASFSLTICAERGALAAAVAAGHLDFRRLVLVTEGSEPVPPCGACREALAEFSPGMTILSEAGGGLAEWSLEDLLPRPFKLDPR